MIQVIAGLIATGCLVAVGAAYWAATRPFNIHPRGERLPPPARNCIVSNWRAW